MNRRRFITGAGSLGLLALLQACRLANYLSVQDETAVRVSTSIPTPTNSPVPTLTGRANTAPEVTDNTPPTPTPTPTPYPPGPPSKLGLLLTQYEAQVLEALE